MNIPANFLTTGKKCRTTRENPVEGGGKSLKPGKKPVKPGKK